jgi:hypothetical protein
VSATSSITGPSAAQFGEELGMAREGSPGLVDDGLVHRGRHHAVELALETAARGAPQHLEHRVGVARIRLAR